MTGCVDFGQAMDKKRHVAFRLRQFLLRKRPKEPILLVALKLLTIAVCGNCESQ
jgi:hypothetical protein